MLRSFRVKIGTSKVSFVSELPKETWTQIKQQRIEVCPESLGAMLEY